MSRIIPTAPSLTPRGPLTFLERARRVPSRSLKLPEGLESIKLDQIAEPTIVTTLKRYGRDFEAAATEGIAPFFAGRSGAYKTLGACALARALYDRYGFTIEFFDCSKEMPDIDRLWYEGHAQRRISEVRTAPFLIVDDFTMLRPNTRDAIVLQEIVNVRYNAKLPTLYTANVVFSKDLSALEDVIGIPLTRRIIERSKGYTVVTK